MGLMRVLFANLTFAVHFKASEFEAHEAQDRPRLETVDTATAAVPRPLLAAVT